MEIRGSFLYAGVFTNFCEDPGNMFHQGKEFWLSQDVAGNDTLIHKMDGEIFLILFS